MKHLLLLAILLISISYAQDSSPLFTNVSAEAGIGAAHRAVWDPDGSKEGYLAVGQAWADYNNDGWLDLYVTGNLEPNTLYLNNGDSTFSLSDLNGQVSLPDAVSGGALWADYDNDGWRDLYVLNYGSNALFRNNEGQGFTEVAVEAGVADTGKGSSATWGDFDRDGFLDLYVVNWSCLPECQPETLELNRDRLYRNNGDGSFTDVTDWLETSKTLGAGFAASFFDADSDGDSDLYVVNDKMTNPIGNVLWRNDGAGCEGWCFTDISAEAGVDEKMHAMGLAVADYDNDSHLDLYATNMMNPMMLRKNLGDGTFEDMSESAGVMVMDTDRRAVGWGTGFFDVDNDGYLDLYLATTGMRDAAPGFYSGSAPAMEDFHHPYPDLLYKNNGDGTFSALSNSSLNEAATMGFAYADYNNDGRLDFVQGNWNSGYALYKNTGSAGAANNWLTVRLIGAGEVNRDAVGSRVYVIMSDGREQMQEVISGQGLGAGSDLALHFGCGETTIESLTVVWPNGERRTFEDVPSNQVWELSYLGS